MPVGETRGSHKQDTSIRSKFADEGHRVGILRLKNIEVDEIHIPVSTSSRVEKWGGFGNAIYLYVSFGKDSYNLPKNFTFS